MRFRATKEGRAKLKRLNEHLQKSKSLRKQKQDRRRRRLKQILFFVIIPAIVAFLACYIVKNFPPIHKIYPMG